jgi:hypothetical protein
MPFSSIVARHKAGGASHYKRTILAARGEAAASEAADYLVFAGRAAVGTGGSLSRRA